MVTCNITIKHGITYIVRYEQLVCNDFVVIQNNLKLACL